MFALMVTILTVVAVILIGVNLPSFNDYWYDDATVSVFSNYFFSKHISFSWDILHGSVLLVQFAFLWNLD